MKKMHVGTLWLVILLMTACLPTSEDYASQSPLLAALERKSGKIAYVGVDGNIYTVNQGGADLQALTNDSRPIEGDGDEHDAVTYLFPTWSWDGERVAFAQVKGSSTDSFSSTIYTAAADGSNSMELYRSEFAEPIYLYWSPDNENVAFLTNSATGGLLLQMAAAKGGEVEVLDAGQPLYWSWAPNSNQMLVHVGGNVEKRLSFLTLQGQIVEEALAADPSWFQAPAWSPDGKRVLFSAHSESGHNMLVLMDNRGKMLEELAELPDSQVAFAWSPDGEKVAYIVSPEESERQRSALGSLTILDLENPSEAKVWNEGQVLAFFWAPNSKKIAYFVPRRINVGSDAAGPDSDSSSVTVLWLYVMDVSAGLSERILVFQPTAEFWTLLLVFDQYHRSATIWSPDSHNVVVTGYTGENSQPSVFVINASGQLDPRNIAAGRIAFWSWD